MIRKLGDRTVVLEEKLRGGELTTTVSKFLQPDEVYGKCKLLAVNTLPKGASIGFHQHVGEFEIYLISKGKGIVTETDRSEHELSEGDIMLCKDGDWHAIRNECDQDLEFVAMVIFNN
ncbi:MAG: cupin domain-containing protein [Oscillospiraceae bacterium]|jgi:mannose-6-phosphate isomerase-like protein (cupin superfamily)|nr:cupin domain-containing protein [Oscillospiraceae bacterium]